MFSLAILIGIYPYLIFLLGLIHLLDQKIILSLTSFYIVSLIIFFRKSIVSFWRYFIGLKLQSVISLIYNHKLSALLISLLLIQILINLIGALGPELAFDALWYHLTIPKIYLAKNSILYLGGHLYYSAMPKWTELIYLVSLSLGNEIVAKIVHFCFGIGILFALYQLSRRYLKILDSLLVTVIFYTNLVVAWMSITAYIDLARTFFQLMALWGFLKFVDTNKSRWLITTALMLGLEISTKLLGLASLALYVILLIFLGYQRKTRISNILMQILKLSAVAFLVVAPWLLFSYIQTGNPFYPFPGGELGSEGNFFDPRYFIKRAFVVFLSSADPISPIYFIFVPLIFIYFKRRSLLIDLLTIYVFLGLCISYIGQIASSGRFILPYLPGFSLLIVLILMRLKDKFLYRSLIIAILLIAVSSIVYRGIANKRFIPLILGKEAKTEFMLNNLEFNVGNFYDVDGFFAKNIKPSDKVLIYGISNLYYINFPYIHESVVKRGDKFNYLLLKDTPLPERFKNWILIYQNGKTHIMLYTLGGKMISF